MQDQLSFRQAQGLLAGMCGCTEELAALALLSTAARHGIDTARIGAQFLAAVKDGPAGRPDVSSDADQLVLSIVEAASLAMLAEAGRALVVEGELDLATGPQLHERAQELGWGHSPDNANPLRQLDLSGVTFIDVRGAHALNEVHAYVAERGGQLHVTPPESLGPRRLLTYAVKSGWLALRFAPEDPTHPARRRSVRRVDHPL